MNTLHSRLVSEDGQHGFLVAWGGGGVLLLDLVCVVGTHSLGNDLVDEGCRGKAKLLCAPSSALTTCEFWEQRRGREEESE